MDMDLPSIFSDVLVTDIFLQQPLNILSLAGYNFPRKWEQFALTAVWKNHGTWQSFFVCIENK
jgi:hypothetical protein